MVSHGKRAFDLLDLGDIPDRAVTSTLWHRVRDLALPVSTHQSFQGALYTLTEVL